MRPAGIIQQSLLIDQRGEFSSTKPQIYPKSDLQQYIALALSLNITFEIDDKAVIKMKVWMVLNTVMWVMATDPYDKALFQVSAEPVAEPPVLAGLDSAVVFTANLAAVTLSLLPGAFSISMPATVLSLLDIQGQGQAIAFGASFAVHGSLSISNATLTSKIKDLSMVSLVGGLFLLSGSLVSDSSATLAAGSGTVVLEDSNFAGNSSPLVSILSPGAQVTVQRCTVWGHSGEFLRVLPKVQTPGNAAISIDRTVFRENRGTGYLVTCSAPLYTGSVTISNSNFLLNEIPQLYFDIGSLQVSVVSCTFQDNSQTSLTVYANGAVLTLKDSYWSGNSQVLFDFRQFTGDLLAAGITVANQRWKGMFRVNNVLAADQCHFTLQDSSILDTYFKVNEPSPGAIQMGGCLVVIQRSLIRNVRVASVYMRDLEGLIVMRIGDLAISGLTLRSSGTAGFGIAMIGGQMNVTDSLLYDLQAGQNLHVCATYGGLTVLNVTITRANGFPHDDAFIGGMPFDFATMQARVVLRNVQIIPGPGGFLVDSPIVCHYSDVDISDVLFRDLTIFLAIIMSMSTGSISNVTIRNCTFECAMFNVYSLDTLRISGVMATDSIVYFLKGIFGPTSSMFIDCSDFEFRNVSATSFIASRSGEVHLRNVSITDCNFLYLTHYQVASNVTLEALKVRRTTGGLGILLYSSLSIIDSHFEDFTSSEYMIVGDRVNITLERVVMKGFSSPLRLSRLTGNSQLLINQSSFSNYRSLADEGFAVVSGTVVVLGSRFYSFNVVLFQLLACEVSIINSYFQEIRNNVLSGMSNAAYGGALMCLDCPSVTVESSSFLNVSAMLGGALALRTSAATEPPLVSVINCEFLMCSATAGGAVYVHNSSFLIEFSRFLGNSATSTGGAVDAYTSPGLRAILHSCVFQRNTAKEGGAVKWRKSPVSFLNVTFQDNAAVYGSDIASFGIQIVGNRSSLTGREASGYPLQLLFELQDHYGQRVTTASAQYMELQSDIRISYRGNQAMTISQGVFNFSQLTIYAQPNSRQTITGVMSYVEDRQMHTLNGSIDIGFRDCVPGEVRKVDRCEYCFPGNVSLHPSDLDCSYCPKHAACRGGNSLLVDSHYWRSSNQTLTLVKCPLKETCLGGEDSKCAEGYMGKVCNECSEGHTRIRTLECGFCGSRIIQWLKISLVAVPIAGFHIAVRTATTTQLFVLKQIINHAQFLSTLCYLRASYPTVLKYWLHSLSYLSSLFIPELPISCFNRVQPQLISAIIGSMATPVLCILLILLSRRQRRKQVIACTSALMFSPMISLYTQMPLLACQAVDSDAEWLFLGMNQQCWQGSHLLLVKAVVVPSVLLNVLLPFFFVSVKSIAAPKKFDELFPLWRSGVKWRCWDLLMYCSKGVLICLVAVSTVAGQLSQVTYGLLIFVITSVLAVSMCFYAYTHWKLFFLVEYSLVIVAVSMGLCAYFIYHSPTEGVTDWLITGVFLALNMGYFGVCVKLWRFPPNLTEEKEEQSACEVVVPPNSIAEFLQASQDLP